MLHAPTGPLRATTMASVAALLLLAAGSPERAGAQGRGVFVDPDSPAGKEYAIPFETARRVAAPGAGEAEAGVPGSAPLFGVGVSPSARGASAGGSAGGGTGRSGGAGRPASTGGGRSGEGPGTRSVPATAGPAGGDGGPPAGILTGAVALGVLLLGGGAGLGLRALLRGPGRG